MSDDPAGGATCSVEELRALVAELREVNTGLVLVLAGKDRQIVALESRIAELERRVGQNSSTSSRPPSSDSPYSKPVWRSSRTRVAKYMGHKDATITLAIYTHLWDGDADEDAARLTRPIQQVTRPVQLQGGRVAT